jgi:hypothetical protein
VHRVLCYVRPRAALEAVPVSETEDVTAESPRRVWRSEGWGIHDLRTGSLHIPRTLWPTQAEAKEELEALLSPYPETSVWHARLVVRHIARMGKKRGRRS